MRLIKEVCEERNLSAIINIHDVMLAQMLAERIVGLRLGEIVYDGPPAEMTPEVLTAIYGEEDWSATIRKVDEDAQEAEEDKHKVIAFPETHQPHRDRMAGLLRATGWIEPAPSEANFILCRLLRSDGATVREALRRRGVFVRTFDHPRLLAHVRISAGTAEDTERLLAAINEIEAEP